MTDSRLVITTGGTFLPHHPFKHSTARHPTGPFSYTYPVTQIEPYRLHHKEPVLV